MTERKIRITPDRLDINEISEDVEYNYGGVGITLKKLKTDVRKCQDDFRRRSQLHDQFEKEISQISNIMQTAPTIETEPIPYDFSGSNKNRRHEKSSEIVLEGLEEQGKVSCLSCSTRCVLL